MAYTKTFTKFINKVNKNLEQIYSKQFLNQLGNHAREILYNRVKSGYGLNRKGGTQKVRLKSLSPEYIKYRQKKKLGEFGTPGKSNLTLSGITLNAIDFKLTTRGFQLVIPDTKHAKAKIAISKVAKYVEEQGRPFFGLTTDERRILEVEITDEIRKLARRK